MDATQPLVEEPNKSVGLRDEGGKFLPGHPPNSPGRPKRKTLTEMIHEKLDKGDSELTWDQLTTIILSMVKHKDKDIVKELWHMTDGKPRESTDVNLKGDMTVIVKREP